MKRFFILLWVLTGPPTLALAHSTHSEDAPPPVLADSLTNTSCPVMTEAIDPNIFIEYQGRSVYFCCKKCIKKFEANPARYLPRLPQFADIASADTLASVGAASSRSAADSTTDSHSGHHPAHAPQLTGLFRLLEYAGRLHPIAVHFPIALAVAAALAEIGFILTRKSLFADAGRFCVWLAVPGAWVAVAFGWANADFADFSDSYTRIVSIHRWLGVASALVIMAAAVSESRSRQVYRAILFIAAGLVGLTGHFGGLLTHGLEYLTP